MIGARPSSVAAAMCLVAAAWGQVPNGSFESATSGGTVMPSGWTSSVSAGATATRIMPYLTCTTDPAVQFPTDGAKWVRLASSIQATPAAPNAASRIESTFTTGTAGTVLKFDAAFATAETPGDPVYNDFMTVTVTVGSSTQVLWTAETTSSAFPVTNTCNAFPSTGKVSVSQDLIALFPALAPTTPVVFRAYVANGGDATVASYGYVDNVRLVPGVPVTPPLTMQFLPQPAGQWILKTTGPTISGAEVYNLVTLSRSTPTGSGPLFGIAFDIAVFDQISAPLGTIPWHVNLDASGNFQVGPFAIPAGLAVDYLSVAVIGGQIAHVTPAATITF